MIKDTFFSMPRFVNFCRKDMVESWRTNLLRIVLMFGVMVIILLWNGYIEYNHRESLADDWQVWSFVQVFFGFSLFGFGCISASFSMEQMKSKTGRLSLLMTPATTFEKFFSRWVVSTLLFLVVFLIAFRLADYTRVLVYSLAYPDLEAIASLPFHSFIRGEDAHRSMFSEEAGLVLFVALYFFTQSCFVLGSVVWPKNALLKTFVAGAIIVVVYILLIVWMSELFDNGPSYSWANQLEKKDVFALLSGACFVFTLFNWTLAYFRLKESEIINRM